MKYVLAFGTECGQGEFLILIHSIFLHSFANNLQKTLKQQSKH